MINPEIELLIIYIGQYKLYKKNCYEKIIVYIFPQKRDDTFFKGFEYNYFYLSESDPFFDFFDKIGYYNVKPIFKQTYKSKDIYLDKILSAKFISEYKFTNLPPDIATKDNGYISQFVFAFSLYPRISEYHKSINYVEKKARYQGYISDSQFSPITIHLLDPYYTNNHVERDDKNIFSKGHLIFDYSVIFKKDLFQDIGIYNIIFSEYMNGLYTISNKFTKEIEDVLNYEKYYEF